MENLITQVPVKMLLFVTNKVFCEIIVWLQAWFTELPGHTVHLWKSRNIASKGYIHILIYTYWKLAEADNSNSYRTPYHKQWSRQCEYLNGYVTVQHCSFRKHRSSKLETWSSHREIQSSHLKTQNVWASRHEDRVSSVELRVSTYFSAVLYFISGCFNFNSIW